MPQPVLTTIASTYLQADIDPLGAQLSALRDAEGHDLQWGGDPAIWKGRAPILFPIIGSLGGGEYRLDDRVYRLPRHGFARDRMFERVEASPTHALFRQCWDEATLLLYPFHFELDLRFAIGAETLRITATVRNLEQTLEMPASFGFHPALRWPLPYGQAKADHAITFAQDEPQDVRRLDQNGLLMEATFPTPVAGRELALKDTLFENDALIFELIHSYRVRYGAPSGPSIEIAFPGMPSLGVWSKPGADFICIEPWHGYSDPAGFSGDFRDKPGIVSIAPGEAVDFEMSLTLHA